MPWGEFATWLFQGIIALFILLCFAGLFRALFKGEFDDTNSSS